VPQGARRKLPGAGGAAFSLEERRFAPIGRKVLERSSLEEQARWRGPLRSEPPAAALEDKQRARRAFHFLSASRREAPLLKQGISSAERSSRPQAAPIA